MLRKHLWVVNLLSLGLMAFFLASSVGTCISSRLAVPSEDEPAGAAGARRVATAAGTKSSRAKATGREICSRNIFDFQNRPCSGEDLDESIEQSAAQEAPGGVPPYCAGEASLVATMASSNPLWAFAMIKSAGKTMPYRAGDDVDGLGSIRRVGWRLVLVDRSAGSDCLLDLYRPAGAEESGGEAVATATPSSPTPPGPSDARIQKVIDEGIQVVSESERYVDRTLVDSVIDNPTELIKQIRILPYQRDGEVQGFKLYGIRRDSLFGKLGLRNGDIVHSINGLEMTSPDRALEAYAKLRSASQLSVSLTRAGKRQNMDFNIR